MNCAERFPDWIQYCLGPSTSCNAIPKINSELLTFSRSLGYRPRTSSVYLKVNYQIFTVLDHCFGNKAGSHDEPNCTLGETKYIRSLQSQHRPVHSAYI